MKKIHDISLLYNENVVSYPGDIPYLKKVSTEKIDRGGVSLSFLEMSSHFGTHIDMPSHFFAKGADSDSYEISDFIMEAYVAEIEQPVITPETLKDIELKKDTGILFKTRNSRDRLFYKKEFNKDFVSISEDAAELLVRKKARLVAIDYITAEYCATEPKKYPIHKKLLGNGILMLEAVDLSDIPQGWYRLFAVPLRIASSEALPVRAFLEEL